MHLRYENTPEDMVAFEEFHTVRSGSKRRKKIARWIMWGIGFVFVFACGMRNLPFWSNLVVSGGAVLFALFFFVLQQCSDKWETRRQYRRNMKGVPPEHELLLKEEGLVSRHDNMEAKIPWSMIERVETTPKYAFVYIAPTLAHVIPLDRITEGDPDAFVGELKRRLL